MSKQLIVIGGGAAGFFCTVNAAVTLFIQLGF
jgi:predicted flavoprotein YhiN